MRRRGATGGGDAEAFDFRAREGGRRERGGTRGRGERGERVAVEITDGERTRGRVPVGVFEVSVGAGELFAGGSSGGVDEHGEHVQKARRARRGNLGRRRRRRRGFRSHGQ